MAPILFNIQDSLLHIEAIGMDVSPRLVNIEPTLVRLQARARIPPQHFPAPACQRRSLSLDASHAACALAFPDPVLHTLSIVTLFPLRMRAPANLKGTCHAERGGGHERARLACRSPRPSSRQKNM